ncbi:hypothetical protein RHMOL_Rhmol02G0285600 [Rhododendron molle]|uniref:Uncharacterized protein n=1 Tax=Rhododendron molle TaxID=49168 RepID=A0ACC0PUT8_RHOML|nr:hypothetical protein RHMOL_Rhmol02G0285600 [Rhododendron molle]
MRKKKKEEEDEEGGDKNNSAVNERRFVSITEVDAIGILMLPEARGKRCFEMRGWLVTISESGAMNLLHPLTRVQIGLPCIATLKYLEHDGMSNFLLIEKGVLSSSPSTGSSKEGRGSYAAFCKCGDKAWTTIKTPEAALCDLTHFNCQFYAVSYQGMIFVCDVEGPNPTKVRVVGKMVYPCVLDYYIWRPYIVELGGDLLIVFRDGYELNFLGDYDSEEDFDVYNLEESRIDYGTSEFRVFKFGLSNWRGAELQTLGDNALFLGDDASISVKVKASKFSRLKPNWIYYIDNCCPAYLAFKRGGGKDMDIFNLEDRSRSLLVIT